MENSIKRQVEIKGLSATEVVLVAVLLAAGAVLRLFTPPIFGITPNFVIVMYCLSILLIKPKFAEMIFISLVAAAICHFTTKAMIPYINFISEPIGAIVAYALAKTPFRFTVNKVSFKPAIITFLGTIASGLTFVFTMKFLILFIDTPKNPAFTGLLLVVITTAIANTIIGQLLYYPIKAATGKQE